RTSRTRVVGAEVGESIARGRYSDGARVGSSGVRWGAPRRPRSDDGPAARQSGHPPPVHHRLGRTGARGRWGPLRSAPSVAVLRLFAQAREAAGAGQDVVDGRTVDDVLAAARARYGADFAALLPRCKVWVN